MSKGEEDRVEKELVAWVTRGLDASKIETGRVLYFTQARASIAEVIGHVWN